MSADELGQNSEHAQQRTPNFSRLCQTVGVSLQEIPEIEQPYRCQLAETARAVGMFETQRSRWQMIQCLVAEHTSLATCTGDLEIRCSMAASDAANHRYAGRCSESRSLREVVLQGCGEDQQCWIALKKQKYDLVKEPLCCQGYSSTC